MIDSYSFGHMQVKGQTYTSDLIIYPDRIDASWWRRTGHHISLDDIKDVLLEKPEVLVIGTGFMGLMKVDDEVNLHMESEKIRLIVEKTKDAVKTFNTVSQTKKAIGAFHLTC
jgi:hypothetical protein